MPAFAAGKRQILPTLRQLRLHVGGNLLVRARVRTFNLLSPENEYVLKIRLWSLAKYDHVSENYGKVYWITDPPRRPLKDRLPVVYSDQRTRTLDRPLDPRVAKTDGFTEVHSNIEAAG
jgi:hypothetical protein